MDIEHGNPVGMTREVDFSSHFTSHFQLTRSFSLRLVGHCNIIFILMLFNETHVHRRDADLSKPRAALEVVAPWEWTVGRGMPLWTMEVALIVY